MNRFAKAAILSVAALTTIASTVDFAAAGDRYWRRHHAVKPWKKRVVIGGVAAGIVAGAVIATRPRVIYRDDPVVVVEPPLHEDATIYGDEDTSVYADPDLVPEREIYRDDAPAEDEYASRESEDQYAAPTFEDEDDFAAQQRDAGNDDDYFPEKPTARVKDVEEPALRKRTTAEKLQAQPARKKQPLQQEANAADLKPWSKEWKTWCAEKFPSFNPQNGTYLGYDKKRHFCKAG